MMMITLSAVVYTIYTLNNPGTKGIFQLIAEMNQPSHQRVNVCPTRVSSVSVIGKAALFQEGLKWYRTLAGTRQELDPIAVEKWFSEYCTVGSELAPAPADNSLPIATFAYVAGLPVTLQQSGSGIFTMNGIHFRSQKLVEAIESIATLPVATKPK